MDHSYLIMPSIMNSIKTQYALLDVVLIIIVMASMGLISELIKKGFDKISTAISNFSTSKKKIYDYNFHNNKGNRRKYL